jgi:peptidyl-prolyl cis-trans isomerase C
MPSGLSRKKEKPPMNKLSASGQALVLALGLAAAPALAADKNTVVAVVNGTELRMSQMADFARQLPPSVGQPPYEALLEVVINNQLVLEQAKKEKLDADPEVKAALKQAESSLMRQAWIARKMRTAVSEEAVRARYDLLAKDFVPAEEVHARHILVETEEAAKGVIADLNKGVDFADLARTKSKDPSGAQNGGDLGYFAQKDMVPEFAAAAFAMQPGQVSKTPVKTQFGWHVIKVEDRRMSSLPTFEQAKNPISQQLAEAAAQQTVTELREKAKIKRFGPDGAALPEGDKK